MATEILNAPLGEVRAASTAGGGTALTSTATRIVLPRNTKFVQMIPRNYGGSPVAVVVQFNFTPWLEIFKSTDGLVTETNITDYSDNAQDNSTGTDITLSSLDTLANGDALYVGSWTKFGGVVVDVDAANGNASVLTVHYWNGSAWTDISATDGTDNAGATFGQDGSITWTVPTAWTKAALQDISAAYARRTGLLTAPQFWTRFSVSAALDSTTTQNSMIAIAGDTTYGELPAGISNEQGITVGPGGFYAITAKTDTAGATANLIVNCWTKAYQHF